LTINFRAGQLKWSYLTTTNFGATMKIRHYNENGLRFVCIQDIIDYCQSVIDAKDSDRSDLERKIAFFTGTTLVVLWTELINSQNIDVPTDHIMAKVSRKLQ
jgi:hypothetical protein